MRFSLIILVALGTCIVLEPSLAGAGDPPVASILSYPEMMEVSYLAIFLGDAISLIAEVDGNDPMTYRWFSEGDSIGSGVLLLNYPYSATGDYEITFEATDAEGDTGRDTCFVSVVRLAVEPTTWSRIKAEFGE